MTESEAPDGWLKAGHVCGVFGVQGWVKVYSFTDPIENILRYQPWKILRNGQWQSIELANSRRQGKTVVAQLAGCDDRDDAQLLVGAELAVKADSLPRLRNGEYYWSDLIGISVVTELGVKLGVVDKLLETGANDVLVVAGDKERLIPWVIGQTVLSVSLDEAQVVVDWDPEF